MEKRGITYLPRLQANQNVLDEAWVLQPTGSKTEGILQRKFSWPNWLFSTAECTYLPKMQVNAIVVNNLSHNCF